MESSCIALLSDIHNMADRRTIVLLCLKRSGTTAIYQAFRNHSQVGIPHHDQTLELWEPNFWNYALKALDGEPDLFEQRLSRACPFLGSCSVSCQNDVFELWDRISDRYGPILFDKTPSLILPGRGLELLLHYRNTGRDVRFLAVVRDPRDVIASQYELWNHLVEGDSPQRREARWVEGYTYLETIRQSLDVMVVRYEDLAADPARFMPRLFAHCGLPDEPHAYEHIRPVHVGRHTSTTNPDLLRWQPGPAMIELMKRHGYEGTMKNQTIRESSVIGQ